MISRKKSKEKQCCFNTIVLNNSQNFYPFQNPQFTYGFSKDDFHHLKSMVASVYGVRVISKTLLTLVNNMPHVIISKSDNLQHFVAVNTSFGEIQNITCYRNYSAIRFANGTRNSANFLSADLCILDFDGNISLETAKEIFADYKAIIVTTKSHQMSSKNGKEIERLDRFRVFIPFDQTITNVYKFERVMKNVTHFFKSDEACVDGARFYYPNPYQMQWLSSGNKLIDTKFYAALPTKGHVRQRNTILQPSDIALEGDIEITDRTKITLNASEWVQELNIDRNITVHCPNPNHLDVHPSAFITRDKYDTNKIFVYCHVCGVLGVYPTNNQYSPNKKGTKKCLHH